MKDRDRTKEELMAELEEMRGRITELEASEAERNAVEEALRESEERYRALVHLGAEVGEAVVMLQDDERGVGMHVFASEAWSRITGYSQEELLNISMADLIHPRDRAEAVERHNRRMRGDELPELYEINIIRKDGTEVPVEVTYAFSHYRGKRVNVGYIRDISERRQAEEALQLRSHLLNNATDSIIAVDLEGNIVYANDTACRAHGYTKEEMLETHPKDRVSPGQANLVSERMKKIIEEGYSAFELEHRRKDGSTFPVEVRGRTVKLGDKTIILSVQRDITERKKMEEEHQRSTRLESLSTLAGGIAHDFNNLLTGILGNVSLAKRYVEPDSKAADRLTEAERASIRARDLTQQLLTFSRGGAPVKKTASIGQLLVDAASFALRGSNIRPEFLLADRLWPVDIDEGQINQVLTNLVINSSDAMPQGGTIQVMARNLLAKEARRLNLTPRKYIDIAVSDQGVGIPAEHINRIFEPYFTTKQKGSGLGLATVYSIIETHDGRITVESEVGKGTTFHVYLPASRATAAKADEPPADVPITGRGKILVMDDEDIIREFLYHELTDVGYDVTVASDGAEAVEQYEKAKNAMEPFDAVILDLTVSGGMGGKETIKKLRKLDPKVRAIASSGYATDPIMANHKKYGFRAVVAKPYRVDELEKTLHNVLKPKQ